MKLPLTLIASNLITLSCVFAAAYMATKDVHGWGWFLVVGVICAHWVSKEDKSNG